MNFRKIVILFFLLVSFFALPAFASETDGTITSGGNAGYAWSDQTGWVNFGITNGNVHITDTGVTGNAWSSTHGWINLAPSNGGVTVAASGVLSGYAWGSSLGWINFSAVSINSSGKFIGNATGATVGTLTFDCTNCSVMTDYRPQNFRTVATPAPSGGGGGGGSGIPSVFGPGGQAVPGTEIETPREGVGTPAGEAPTKEITPASPAGGLKENPPLFDVEIGPGPAASKSNSVYYIIAIVLAVLAGIAFYIFRRWKKHKYEDEI